ncbi:MAG: type I secretion system permease/ATPase [Robiginitomaculum sp.]|nr:MAG: type I secretion system permease/ATPase [Robiginitomaculum sp.]
MQAPKQASGQTSEEGALHSVVGKALMTSKSAFWGIGIFSAFINLLMLTGPLYMLQVYDRVLASSSMSTLVGISVLMGMMYIFMGYFDLIRSRILVRIGDKLEKDLGARTFSIWLKQGLYGRAGQRHRPLQDLGTLRQFFSGAAPTTFFDIPWAPIYIGVMFIFHPMLGWAGIVGAIVIFFLAFLNEKRSRKPMQDANILKAQAQIFAQSSHRNADVITAMGMGKHMQTRWQDFSQRAAQETVKGGDIAGGLTATSKAFRMFVQSAILGLGAALAVKQVITPGTMIAGSIVMGRALAPIQMVVGQWRGFIATRQAFHRLNKFYEIIPEDTDSMQLPEPTGHLSIENIIAAPPGSQIPALTGLNFTLEPGQGLGVIGPSASGKSTLARLLVGIWLPQKGSVRLDGASYDQWNRDILGPYIGYLPQEVELFDGSIGENIARFDPQARAEDVVVAAKRAAVHDMILRMPDGYDTKIGEGGAVLSGGQIQRVALARAVFGDPVLVVMDEPNANLDADGDAALSAAITDLRRRQKTVVVMAHRPSAIASVDTLLVLKEGQQIAFGAKDEVLVEIAKANAKTSTKGAVSGRQPQNAQRKKRVNMPSYTANAKTDGTT